MELSTRDGRFSLDDFIVYDARQVIQYGGSRFVVANFVEELEVLSREEIGVELNKRLLEDSTELCSSNELKVLIHVSDRMYHVLLDTIPLVVKIHKLHPEARFVFYLRGNPGAEETNMFHKCLIDVLEELGASYFLIYNEYGTPHSPVYKVTNFICLDHVKYNIHDAISLLDVKAAVDLIKRMYVKSEGLVPNKKVYLTRPDMPKTFYKQTVFTDDGSYPDDLRIYEEEKLKEYFLGQGYEIVTPEKKFQSFAEQVQFMSEVSELAAVSCSGLTNSLFMQPNGKVIEIMAEVVTEKYVLPDGRLATNQMLPTEYFPLSFIMGHTHRMIPTNRDSDVAIQKLRGEQ